MGCRRAVRRRSVDLTTVQQYRSLCLLALGRGAEAEEAIGAVVTARPSYQPSEAEASPRVRTAFTEVRQRLLPQIAQARYGAGARRPLITSASPTPKASFARC